MSKRIGSVGIGSGQICREIDLKLKTFRYTLQARSDLVGSDWVRSDQDSSIQFGLGLIWLGQIGLG